MAAPAPDALHSLSSRSPRWLLPLAVTVLLLATALAYRNSLDGPFVFDDIPTIVDNPTIRKLRPLTEVLSPPAERGLTVNGRPLVNLSLALNHAAGGLAPRGYHLFNVALHALAALTLFGLVRRTALRPARQRTPGGADDGTATLFALATGLLWLLHPLQTAAVSYIVQRAEAMMGLFYLLTLYAFARSLDSARPTLWRAAGVAACFAGMATKEVMATAPVLVFLYDRTFGAGTFRDAWRSKWRYYAALASSWLLLAWLMRSSGGRGGTAGFGLPIHWADYAVTQIGAVAHYLRLAVWPRNQVFDYGGTVLVENLRAVWPQAILLLGLASGTLWALARRPVPGFLGAAFFAVLAPTSSVVPVADTMFEHRMYLPLAAVVALAAGAAFALLPRRVAFAVCAAAALALGVATTHRNEIFRSERALWTDTVTKRPENARAHYTLGSVLAAAGETAGAITHFEAALRLKPNSPEAHGNYGNLLTRLGRLSEARAHYEAALAARPTSADTHNNLGNLALREGLIFAAVEHFETALRFQPSFADAHNNLANVLMRMRRAGEAIGHYEAALTARPGFFDAHLNLANALGEIGRLDDALRHYRAALALRPDAEEAHYNLGVALAMAGRNAEAAAAFAETLRLQPSHENARRNLDALRGTPATATR